ncbi:MAG: NAD(P)-binding domain-containing protein [Roseobacter sp.]
MSRIGFIGTGHIAAPMVRFLAGQGHEVCVSQRNAEVAAALAASHGVAVLENADVLARSDIVFLCLRPHLAEEVLRGLQFRADQQIVSAMAGVPLARLEQLCAPATAITATIPMVFLEHGGCPLPACPDAGPLEGLFAPENPVLPVADEAAFNQHFAIATVVPAVLEVLATSAAWLGHATGDDAVAEFYTAQLVAGYLANIEKAKAGALAQERDALATTGTLSLQMVDALRAAGVPGTVSDALSGIGKRLEGA